MFDIHQNLRDEYGVLEDGAIEGYCNGLIEEFAASPEGSAAVEYYGEIGWVHTFLYYGFNYIGNAPPEMSPRDVKEVLFDIFPRKVSTEPDSAAEIIGELQAFFEFLQRQYGLANAASILKGLGNDAARRLKTELADSRKFGMAKSIVMLGTKAGFEMTTQAGMNEFMLAYSAGRLGDRSEADELKPDRVIPNRVSPSSAKPSPVQLSASDRRAREAASPEAWQIQATRLDCEELRPAEQEPDKRNDRSSPSLYRPTWHLVAPLILTVAPRLLQMLEVGQRVESQPLPKLSALAAKVAWHLVVLFARMRRVFLAGCIRGSVRAQQRFHLFQERLQLL